MLARAAVAAAMLAATAQGAYVATLGAYPGYDTTEAGAYSISGTVTITDPGDGQTAEELGYPTSLNLEVSMTGADPGGGGVHIHTGTSCSDESSVGGHYYLLENDMWNGVIPYTEAQASGTVFNMLVQGTNLTLADVTGHAVVVHSSTGTRIGCGVITYTPPSPPPAPLEQSDAAVSRLITAVILLSTVAHFL